MYIIMQMTPPPKKVAIIENNISHLFIWGKKLSPTVLAVPLLETEKVLDPVHGDPALSHLADGEGKEEGHGETDSVVQG